MTNHGVPDSSLSTSILTTFINSSQKLPISASLAPHPVCCYQNLRKTSRLLRPFRGTCSTGFAPLRCRRRTPFQAIGGHTPSPASRLPDGQDNDLQDTGSRRDNAGFLQANSLIRKDTTGRVGIPCTTNPALAAESDVLPDSACGFRWDPGGSG